MRKILFFLFLAFVVSIGGPSLLSAQTGPFPEQEGQGMGGQGGNSGEMPDDQERQGGGGQGGNVGEMPGDDGGQGDREGDRQAGGPPREERGDGGFFDPNVPTECFGIWFSNSAVEVGDDSCGKKLTRFKCIDEPNQQNQMIAAIMEAARASVNTAGVELVEDTCLDITDLMNEEVEAKKDDERVKQGGDEGDHDFELLKFEICRGEDGENGETIYQLAATMQNTFRGESSEDAFLAVTSLLEDASTGLTTQTVDFNASFGPGSMKMQGKRVSETADDSTKSININLKFAMSHGALVCSDPRDPRTCTESSEEIFEDSTATVLSQEFDDDGNDVLKCTWVDSHGTNKTTFLGGTDATGAGCLESKQDFDDVFKQDDNFRGEGGGHCGPYAEGDLHCSIFKEGREFAVLYKSERDLTSCDAASGACGSDFNCGDFQKNEECGGYCPDGEGLPSTPPEPQRDFSQDTEGMAWMSGCFEGTGFDHRELDSIGIEEGVASPQLVVKKMEEGPGPGGPRPVANRVRKGECWDATGKVATTSSEYDFTDNRDTRIDPRFNEARNFNNEDRREFRAENRCAVTHDPTTGADLRPDGSIFCWPDFNTDPAPDGVPLCSQSRDLVENGAIADPCGNIRSR